MKSLLVLILSVAMLSVGCGKDDKGGGGGTAARGTDKHKDRYKDTAVCVNARHQNGRFYDWNGVELPQCRKTKNNYMKSKYLLKYDNDNCHRRKYKKRPTFMVNINGQVRCAAQEYFDEVGNGRITPQYGRNHYVGYAPRSYYQTHGRYGGVYNPYGHGYGYGYGYGAGYGGYGYGGGTYCSGWGCDIGDGKWNFGDYAAIALGAGLIFAIANQ